MIGHYLLTLTQEQEDRVLTMKMEKCTTYVIYDHNGIPQCGCLRAVVHDLDQTAARYNPIGKWRTVHGSWELDLVGIQYDALCDRFGVERVNRAIRNRILSNRARRELAARAPAVAPASEGFATV